jgi:hypothetical protein
VNVLGEPVESVSVSTEQDGSFLEGCRQGIRLYPLINIYRAVTICTQVLLAIMPKAGTQFNFVQMQGRFMKEGYVCNVMWWGAKGAGNKVIVVGRYGSCGCFSFSVRGEKRVRQRAFGISA